MLKVKPATVAARRETSRRASTPKRMLVGERCDGKGKFSRGALLVPEHLFEFAKEKKWKEKNKKKKRINMCSQDLRAI